MSASPNALQDSSETMGVRTRSARGAGRSPVSISRSCGGISGVGLLVLVTGGLLVPGAVVRGSDGGHRRRIGRRESAVLGVTALDRSPSGGADDGAVPSRARASGGRGFQAFSTLLSSSDGRRSSSGRCRSSPTSCAARFSAGPARLPVAGDLRAALHGTCAVGADRSHATT